MPGRFIALAALAALAALVLVAALVVAFMPAGEQVPATGVTRTISARTTVFLPAVLSVPPNTPVTLSFRNDSSEPHTLILLAPLSGGTDGPVGPGRTDAISFTAPGPGEYTFVCNVHEGMSGIVRVQ